MNRVLRFYSKLEVWWTDWIEAGGCFKHADTITGLAFALMGLIVVGLILYNYLGGWR